MLFLLKIFLYIMAIMLFLLKIVLSILEIMLFLLHEGLDWGGGGLVFNIH